MTTPSEIQVLDIDELGAIESVDQDLPKRYVGMISEELYMRSESQIGQYRESAARDLSLHIKAFGKGTAKSEDSESLSRAYHPSIAYSGNHSKDKVLKRKGGLRPIYS